MPGRISKNQHEIFFKLLRTIELTSIRTKTLTYESFEKKPLTRQHGSVEVREKSVDLDKARKQLNCSVGFDIVIRRDNGQVSFTMSILYLLEFRVEDVNLAEFLLEDKETSQMLSRNQLVKLAWSYMRSELSHALASAGLAFSPLPLFR